MKNTIKILDKYEIKYEIKDNKIYLENTTLDLSNKNIEGNLDVSMVENLHYLNCYKNQINQLLYNDKLKYLQCSGNNLTEIECKENLKNLKCSHNKLTEIVCNDNLELLYCYRNNISKIVCNIYKL